MKCMEIFILYYGRWDKSQSQDKANRYFDFDLQLFNGEKTEEATPKKKADAKKKGQVGKSQEINSTFILLMAFFSLKILGSYIYDQIAYYMIFVFSNIPENITTEVVMNIFFDVVILLMKTALPIMLSILVVSLIVNLFQVGINFTFEPIMPSLSKLNPISGMQRMFSKRSLVELLKSIFKILIIGYFIVGFLKKEIVHLPKLVYVDIYEALRMVSTMLFSLAFQICEVLLVLAVLDYLYQKWQHNESIKMSKQDIKDEAKQSEGNPQLKAKIKQKQRAIAMQRMMQEVPKADVIITNPTHFAVALKYEKGMMAPVIVAKGQDLIAQRIKSIAKEAKVAIVENKPLARALYATTEVGDVVPHELYKSVAEVLAYVYRLKKKLS
ncbi:flagellar biosynthesis protein FlhB [Anaerosinus massiliensis]|uniref:flagellar biosynthesis protein FlhB n=1 Tax=Massilibacillus massiliensis TaxID=1806837 RepID=UPI000B187D42|nr:flagellar biosynthesis protein FlhB [Massilibacillus massiliensis]